MPDDGPDDKSLVTLEEAGELAAQTARTQMLAALDTVGINMQVLAVHANDLLSATKQKAQFDAKSGQFVYSAHMSDNTTRLNALKMMLDVHDVMPSKKVDINDKRQTKDLADRILQRMEQSQQLGVDDRGVPQPCELEEEIINGEVVEGPSGASFIATRDPGLDEGEGE